MILAKLKDARDYRGIHPRLDAALDLLTEEYLKGVETMQRNLEGDALYVTRFDYETVPVEESFFESHRRYLDIHVMVKGCERVDISHPDGLTEFTQKGDFWGYHGEAEQSLILKPGDFLVVFPGDAHRLKIHVNGQPEPVSKVVFKVLFNESV